MSRDVFDDGSQWNEANTGSHLRDGRAGQDLPRASRSRLLGYVRLFGDGRSDVERSLWFCSSAELEHIMRLAPVSNVYIAGSGPEQPKAVQAAIEVCQRFGVPFAPPAYSGVERVPPAHAALAGGYSGFMSDDSTARQVALKRVFDVVLSAAALLVLLPLLALLAAIIKLSDGGPIFFGQQRVGFQGQIFQMLKFRSMVVNAEELKPRLESQNESNGPVFKMKRDPRITTIGRFLRRYSIDELPQLINVLRGDMSLVGPRPPVPDEVAQYEPWQFRRFSVRPGLTCLWQVSPDRYRISFNDWMRLDLQYIDDWSLRLDFDLILRTFWAVLAGTGE